MTRCSSIWVAVAAAQARASVRGCRLLLVILAALAGAAVGAQPVAALPEGRVYEMVSPVYKGGFGAGQIEAVAPDGESVMFYSSGAFGGAPKGAEIMDYIARRHAQGWVTTPTSVPAGALPDVIDRDVSPTLETTLALGKPGSSGEVATQTATENEFLLHSTTSPDTTAFWSVAGMVMPNRFDQPLIFSYRGASPDFCHLLFANLDFVRGGGSLLPEDEGALDEQTYELDRGCGKEPVALRLIGVRNRDGAAGEPELMSRKCRAELGIEVGGEGSLDTFNAVADDGHEIFFTDCVSEASNRQVFVTLDGTRTLEVSRALEPGNPYGGCEREGVAGEVPCNGAASRGRSTFIGASEDGSKVFFTTRAALVAGDQDGGNDLYMATIGCPESAPGCAVSERVVTGLTQISHDPNGAEAALQGVTALSPDGERVYFVAKGDLLSAEAQAALEGRAQAVPHAGAENLYVYDTSTATMGFVADLCSGFEASGESEDPQCPSTTKADSALWERLGGETQTAGAGGRFLVFATYAQLTRSDTDAAKDIYRYDALTGTLDRVSSGEGGADRNGNESFEARIPPANWGGRSVQLQYEMNNRAISENGSQIIFKSAAPLSPDAINGLTNVYEWHKQEGEAGEGTVSLISGGSASEPVEDAVISPEGNDIFFHTSQSLVADDTDGEPDIYDARIGGGFAEPLAEEEACSADACQGPLSSTAPLLVPGSATQAPGGNVASHANKTVTKAKKAKKKKQAKRRRRGGNARGAHAGTAGRRCKGVCAGKGGRR